MMSKKLALLILVVLMCFTVVLSACGELNDLIDNIDDFIATTDTFKTAEEVKASLTNYWFEYKFTSTDEDGTSTQNLMDIKNSNGWYYQYTDDFAVLMDNQAQRYYVMYPEDKTAYYSNKDEYESFSGWGMYLFGWYGITFGFQDAGTEVVVGRDCKKYTYKEANGSTYTYYIDKEYDICLKWVLVEDGETNTFEFTKFQIDNVTDADTIDRINEYAAEPFPS